MYKAVGRVIKTGQPIEIVAKGKRLKLSLDEDTNIFSKLVPHNIIVGDPEELVDLHVSQWHEEKNLSLS